MRTDGLSFCFKMPKLCTSIMKRAKPKGEPLTDGLGLYEEPPPNTATALSKTCRHPEGTLILSKYNLVIIVITLDSL